MKTANSLALSSAVENAQKSDGVRALKHKVWVLAKDRKEAEAHKDILRTFPTKGSALNYKRGLKGEVDSYYLQSCFNPYEVELNAASIKPESTAERSANV